MLLIEEIGFAWLSLGYLHVSLSKLTSIAGIQLHWLKAIVLLQHSARPFPYTANFAVTSKLVAKRSHGSRVPVGKSHIDTFETNEVAVRVRIIDCAGGTVD